MLSILVATISSLLEFDYMRIQELKSLNSLIQFKLSQKSYFESNFKLEDNFYLGRGKRLYRLGLKNVLGGWEVVSQISLNQEKRGKELGQSVRYTFGARGEGRNYTFEPRIFFDLIGGYFPTRYRENYGLNIDFSHAERYYTLKGGLSQEKFARWLVFSPEIHLSIFETIPLNFSGFFESSEYLTTYAREKRKILNTNLSFDKSILAHLTFRAKLNGNYQDYFVNKGNDLLSIGYEYQLNFSPFKLELSYREKYDKKSYFSMVSTFAEELIRGIELGNGPIRIGIEVLRLFPEGAYSSLEKDKRVGFVNLSLLNFWFSYRRIEDIYLNRLWSSNSRREEIYKLTSTIRKKSLNLENTLGATYYGFRFLPQNNQIVRYFESSWEFLFYEKPLKLRIRWQEQGKYLNGIFYPFKHLTEIEGTYQLTLLGYLVYFNPLLRWEGKIIKRMNMTFGAKKLLKEIGWIDYALVIDKNFGRFSKLSVGLKLPGF